MASVQLRITAALAVVIFPQAAQAAEPAPRWEVAEICANAPDGPQCARIESQNRRSVLLRWQAISTDDQRACKAEVSDSGALSYKSLLNCLEARQLKALEGEPHAQAPTPGAS